MVDRCGDAEFFVDAWIRPPHDQVMFFSTAPTSRDVAILYLNDLTNRGHRLLVTIDPTGAGEYEAGNAGNAHHRDLEKQQVRP